MSLRSRENRRQLRTAPCGRPLVIVVLGEESELTQTMKLRFSMKDFMKDTSLGGNPRFASLAKRIWWLTLSYAPSKSTNAANRTLLFDRDLLMAFAYKIKASVEE